MTAQRKGKKNMKRVLISDTLSPEGIEILKNTPGLEVDVMTNLTPDELKGIIKDYDGLAIRSATKVTKEIIEKADNLKVVGRAGIGVDNVDVNAASKRGIVVMNTPGGNTITTGEHSIAMMFALARQIPQATASMKSGKWEKNKFMGNEVYNKTLGIIGIGRVGTIVADRAQGLKMNVIAFDPFLAPETAEKMGITLVTLDELLKRSHFISVHTPLTKDTKNIINAASIAKMRNGVFIVNCARGGIINEKDLLEALKSGKVAGAALDVFDEEPTKNTELVNHPNVICTPHLGAATDEAQRNVAIAIAEQIADFLTKGEIRNAINFPSVSAELLTHIQPYLALAEKLGTFEAQIVKGGIEEVAVEYAGDIVNYNVAPLTIALHQGAAHADPERQHQFHQRPLHRQGAQHQGRRVQDERGEGLHEHDLRDDQDDGGEELRRRGHLRQAGRPHRADREVLHGGDPRGAHDRALQQRQTRRHRQHRPHARQQRHQHRPFPAEPRARGRQGPRRALDGHRGPRRYPEKTQGPPQRHIPHPAGDVSQHGDSLCQA